MGPSKGFSSGEVQDIVTKKHDATQNKIAKEDAQTATFAAGCFWGVQLAFQRVPGVASSMVSVKEKVEYSLYFVFFRWVTRLAVSSTPPTMRSAPAKLVRRQTIWTFDRIIDLTSC